MTPSRIAPRRVLPAVIVVTGYPSDETRWAALTAGAAVFLAKPFATAGLLSAVRSSLGETAAS